MNGLKKSLGLVWMILGVVAVILLFYVAFVTIKPGSNEDFHKPLPWIIILTIFTPIGIGLTVFGYYAWKGEYQKV